MSKIAIVGEFNVKPEHRAEFETLMAGHARTSFETEPGCERFDLLIPRKDDGRVMIYEVYTDQAALDFHAAQPRLATLREAYKDMIVDRKLSICTIG